MAGIALDYQFDVSPWASMLEQLAVTDFTPLMQRAGNLITTATHHRFYLTETPDGDKWEASYRAETTGGTTLTDTATLRDSYTYNVLGPDAVEIGSNVEYAAIHHEGGTIKPVGEYLTFPIGGGWARVKSVEIPARPALGISSDDGRDLQDMTSDFIRELIYG